MTSTQVTSSDVHIMLTSPDLHTTLTSSNVHTTLTSSLYTILTISGLHTTLTVLDLHTTLTAPYLHTKLTIHDHITLPAPDLNTKVTSLPFTQQSAAATVTYLHEIFAILYKNLFSQHFHKPPLSVFRCYPRPPCQVLGTYYVE